MRCPNPDCPYARKRGRAAEYRAGVAVCSDCGAALVDGGAIEVPSTSTAFAAAAAGQARRVAATPWPSHLIAASVVTAIAALFPLALGFVPLPYVERDLIRVMLGEGGSAFSLSSVSAGALGVTPWLSAALLVEIVAVLVPRLRRLRHAGPEARVPLDRAALLVGALFALAQSWMLVSWLSGVTGAYRDSVAPELWALGPRLVVIGTLIGGACLARLAAAVIDRNGVGNGLVLVTGAALLVEVGQEVARQADMVRQGVLLPFQIVVTLALFAIPAVIAWRLVHVRATPSNGAFVVRPSAGIVPATFAFVVPSLAATLATFGVATSLSTTATTLAGALVAAALVPLFSRVWAPPARIALLHARADGRSLASAEDTAQARAEVADAQAPTWMLNAVVVAVFVVGTLWLPYGFLNVVGVVVLVATARDLDVEVRARRAASTPLVSVGALHRLDLVNPVLDVLAREKIDATLRGAHVRALSHFFAPWIPIEIFVEEAHAERARSIVREAITRCVEADPSQRSA